MGQGDVEALRQACDALEAQVSLPALDRADVGPMDAGSICQLFLRDVELVTQVTDPSTEGHSEVIHDPDRGQERAGAP